MKYQAQKGSYGRKKKTSQYLRNYIEADIGGVPLAYSINLPLQIGEVRYCEWDIYFPSTYLVPSSSALLR